MNHPLLRLFDGKDDTSPELQDDVKELQTDLNRFGFDIAVDGAFASETEAAVHQFQMDHGLVPDGIVGPQTWAALEETQPPDPASTFPTTISGSNPAVRADFAEAIKFKVFINTAAQKIGVDPVVVGGIGSRESRWGLINRPLGPAGTGDFSPRRFPTAFRTGALPPDGGGYGRGLMQIDFDAFPFARTATGRTRLPTSTPAVMSCNQTWNCLAEKHHLPGETCFRRQLRHTTAEPETSSAPSTAAMIWIFSLLAETTQKTF
jgi:hypothetical protein